MIKKLRCFVMFLTNALLHYKIVALYSLLVNFLIQSGGMREYVTFVVFFSSRNVIS